MKTYYTLLALSLAFTACAAPEPGQPPEPVPVAPVLPAFQVEPAVGIGARAPHVSVKLAQAPVPVPPKGDVFFSRSKGGRSLIIQSSDPDPKTYANIEEDLNVMYRILSKTRKQDDGGFGLGSFLSGSSGSSVKSMYIEGYGAVFMLSVRFPLVAPQPPEEQAKPKENTSEEWERAKRELSSRNTLELDLERAWSQAIGPAGEEYDAQKVEDLTVSVLESLKNATHIRNLKSDEFVTVAILGAEGAPHRVSFENEDEDGKSKRKTRVEAMGAPRGESTMTIRAKKSDIDEFAKGKLNLDAFRKKAKMLVYTRPGDPSARMNVQAFPMPLPARQ
jgi:hypothetical protein